MFERRQRQDLGVLARLHAEHGRVRVGLALLVTIICLRFNRPMGTRILLLRNLWLLRLEYDVDGCLGVGYDWPSEVLVPIDAAHIFLTTRYLRSIIPPPIYKVGDRVRLLENRLVPRVMRQLGEHCPIFELMLDIFIV